MKTNNIFVNTVIPTTSVIPAKAGIQTEDLNPVSLAPCLRGGDGKKNVAVLLAIASFLLTASFVFADPVPPIPIPLPDNVFKVENDQSVQKTERVATIEYKPRSSAYVVRGNVQYRDVEGTAYLEMWNVMPDGSRYFSRTLDDYGAMQKIQGTCDWRVFSLPFYLMELKPESVSLEINIVMPGKGTIEVTGLTVSDYPKFGGGEWFDARTGNMGGGIGGTLLVCFGALFGILCGVLVSRGKGKRLLYGALLIGEIVGVFFLVTGISAVLCGQPCHVWYPFILLGVLQTGLLPFAYLTIRQQYAQVELRKMQALDA
jgi:hypothetical protein